MAMFITYYKKLAIKLSMKQKIKHSITVELMFRPLLFILFY